MTENQRPMWHLRISIEDSPLIMGSDNSIDKDSIGLLENDREGKGKRLWKKVKYQLVEYHSLPAFLRDNEYILGHYRSEWPMKQVLLSIFTIHNETLNVWTHLIGFFLFLALTIYTAMKVPQVVDLNSLQHLPDILKNGDLHKLQSELLTCLPSMPDLQRLRDEISSWHIKELLYNCLPVRFSSSNHTDVCVLHNVKEDLANLIAPLVIRPITRLDYAGIAALISTSFFPPVYYSFMCYPFFCNLYLGFITILGIATILVSLLPVFQTPEFRTIRASLFLGMGLSGAGPILHKLFLFWGEPEVFYTTGYEILMGSFYGLGALVYATRIPERWMPGKFDIAGHSHQLFHVLVVAGAYTHYRAGLVYLRWRDIRGC
ncbi:unnamed protein product [Vicia faba]|uniref:Heptahelical transmembrane protein 4-like n=1 Tax=Vicia faba TaxID=3906 RepID=A0AAV0YWT9_VICFA|nr:unnamed protein product [Vicia faba]